MISLKDKNVLITGSSRGIGQQVAMGLAELGCNVIVHARKLGNCAATQKLLEPYPVKVYTVEGDLTTDDSTRKLIGRIRELGVDVDILYNNAAYMSSYRTDIWSHTWEDWTENFAVNVIAMYKLCAAFMPGMIERGFGRVVNLSSGIAGEPELVPYGASKWAVNKLSKELAVKLDGTGVRINMLDPGWLRTDMGGPHADHPVEAVLPGALAPALVEDDGPNGQLFSAIGHELDPNLLDR